MLELILGQKHRVHLWSYSYTKWYTFNLSPC